MLDGIHNYLFHHFSTIDSCFHSLIHPPAAHLNFYPWAYLAFFHFLSFFCSFDLNSPSFVLPFAYLLSFVHFRSFVRYSARFFVRSFVPFARFPAFSSICSFVLWIARSVVYLFITFVFPAATRSRQSPGSNKNKHQAQGRSTNNRRCSNTHWRIRRSILPRNWTCLLHVLKLHFKKIASFTFH